jgi:hypothetical protein
MTYKRLDTIIPNAFTRRIQELRNEIETSGGFTINNCLQPHGHDTGYMVASGDAVRDEIVIPFNLLSINLLGAVIADLKRYQDHYIGAWLNPEKRVVHFELSDIIPLRGHAIELGRRRNQKAIWDIANNKEILI